MNDTVVPRRRDLLAESAILLFGEPLNAAERGRFGKALKNLREAGVDHDELPGLALAYRSKFPSAAFTLMAVATRPGELRHWLQNQAPGGEQLAREMEWHRQMREQRWGHLTQGVDDAEAP